MLASPDLAIRSRRYDAFKNNPYTMLALTQHGGHLGYYEGGLAAWTKVRCITSPTASLTPKS